jgi:hypothetical protein
VSKRRKRHGGRNRWKRTLSIWDCEQIGKVMAEHKRRIRWLRRMPSQ